MTRLARLPFPRGVLPPHRRVCDGGRNHRTTTRGRQHRAWRDHAPRRVDAICYHALDPGDATVPEVPTACTASQQDCRRVAAQSASGIPAGSPSVGYIQVGPFGCPTEEPCPTTLAARPEGDVVLEFPGGVSAFHVKVDAQRLEVQPLEASGILLAPTTRPPLPAAAQPFTLGHCGLWSGIDLGGSWWDPSGSSMPVTPTPSTRGRHARPRGSRPALFTSNGGLIVQLVRRDGEKFLPFCQ